MGSLIDLSWVYITAKNILLIGQKVTTHSLVSATTLHYLAFSKILCFTLKLSFMLRLLQFIWLYIFLMLVKSSTSH